MYFGSFVVFRDCVVKDNLLHICYCAITSIAGRSFGAAGPKSGSNYEGAATSSVRILGKELGEE